MGVVLEMKHRTSSSELSLRHVSYLRRGISPQIELHLSEPIDNEDNEWKIMVKEYIVPPPLPGRGGENYFLTCDVVDHVLVGDVILPLLDSISLGQKLERGERLVQDRWKWVKLNKGNYKQLRFGIVDGLGERVVGRGGILFFHFKLARDNDVDGLTFKHGGGELPGQ